MENYKKGEVIEIEEEQLPFPSLPDGTIHMKVKAGSRISNLLGYAIIQFKLDDCTCIVFSGAGNAVTKAITCVEIMNRKFKNVKQVNEIGYRKIEETWEPISPDSGLDSLKVTREIPAIYILLTKQPPEEDTSEKNRKKPLAVIPPGDQQTFKRQQEGGPQYSRRPGTFGQRKRGRKQWKGSDKVSEPKSKS